MTFVYDLTFRDSKRVENRLQHAFRDELRSEAAQSPLFRDLQRFGVDEGISLESLIHPIRTWIDQSGLALQPWHLVAISASVCMGTLGLLLLITRSPILAILAGLTALPWPWIYVQATRVKRRRNLCRQLPEAFEVMSRAIRVGQTIQAAFQVVANDFPAPISREFAYCYEQQHLGVPHETTLRDLARRTGIMELRIFVVALIINTRAGGNLSELLNKLASLIRKRLTLQSRMLALTGEGRMQAVVLTALPAVVFAVLLFWNPLYIAELTSRPLILCGCVAAQLVGGLWIRKITTIDF